MTENLKKTLKDSPLARWSALLLLSSAMFFAYMFIDVLSPLQSLLQTSLGWDPEVYGTFTSSEYFLNVVALFLIFAGIILDKMGVRFTALLSAVIMIVGAIIKWYGISEYFNNGGFGYEFFNSFLPSFPPSAKVACIGFAIFGCGVEMAGVTVSKGIVKWFKGKELALAMSVEMAIARLGVFAVFRLSPILSDNISVTKPVLFCILLLLIGLISISVYAIIDKKLDKQLGELNEEPEEPFKIKDLSKLFTSRTFMIVAGLCVLYYSAIFPFQKFATNMLESRLNIPTKEASNLFSFFPIGAMFLTPFLGIFLDRVGKGATMLIIGAILMSLCHLTFALAPLTKTIAYFAIVLLGISFSLVPASLWPSVPKLVENRYLGSGYSVIFWIQNIGLMIFPILIGWSLNTTNPGLSEEIKDIKNSIIVMAEQQTQLESYLQADQIELAQNIKKGVDSLNISFHNSKNREVIVSNIKNDLEKLKSYLVNSELANSEDINKIYNNMNQEITKLSEIKNDVIYNYTVPMLIFASLGLIALLLGIWLKIEDKKRKYGLELPNIKPSEAVVESEIEAR